MDLIYSLFLDCAFKAPLVSIVFLASTLLAEPITWSGGCNQEKEVPYTKQKERIAQKDLAMAVLSAAYYPGIAKAQGTNILHPSGILCAGLR